MIEIARFSGSSVIGVNNSHYQIEKGETYLRKANMTDQCRFVEADFMELPLPEASFDAIYSIEATCHAPDKVALYNGLRRLLKPSAELASYEWCLTSAFDPTDTSHGALKKAIERGNGVPELGTTEDVVRDLESAGFEVVVATDKSDDPTMGRALVRAAHRPGAQTELAPQDSPRQMAHAPLTGGARGAAHCATRITAGERHAQRDRGHPGDSRPARHLHAELLRASAPSVTLTARP